MTVRRIAIFAALLVMTAAIPAAKAQYLGGGLKAGWNLSTLSGEQADRANVESIGGLMAGAFLRFSLGGGFSVQPEVLFSRKGAEGDTLGTRGTIKLDYIELPLLIRYAVPIEKKVIPTLYGGAAFSRRLSATGEVEDGGQTTSIGLDSQVVGSDVGAIIGLELAVPAGRRSMTVEARYTWGLRSVDDAGEEDIKNRVLTIALGIWFAPRDDGI